MRPRFAALVLALVAAACQRAEPTAGGKSLRHWKREATQVPWFPFWNSTKDERRLQAFRRLVEIGEPAVPALLDLLRHDESTVAADASGALAQLGPRSAGAVPDLVEMLNGDEPALRRRAAGVLGAVGPAAESAVPSLAALLGHPDPGLRRTAAEALERIGGSGHAALERAGLSEDVRRREAAFSGTLTRPLDPAERRDFLAAGLADPSPEVRLRALNLLLTGRRDEAEALAEYLVRALNDTDPQVNRAAHGVLTWLVQRQVATPRLLAAVLREGDAEARADAAWRLGPGPRGLNRAGPVQFEPAVAEALLGALNDAEPKVRLYAARALAYGAGPASRQGIRTLRRDMPNVEPILAVRAARALWDVTHDVAELRSAYEAGLADPQEWNRLETISAIADMGKAAEAFTTQLERLSNDPKPEVRERARRVLDALRRRRAE